MGDKLDKDHFRQDLWKRNVHRHRNDIDVLKGQGNETPNDRNRQDVGEARSDVDWSMKLNFQQWFKMSKISRGKRGNRERIFPRFQAKLGILIYKGNRNNGMRRIEHRIIVVLGTGMTIEHHQHRQRDQFVAVEVTIRKRKSGS